jgi:hypothetical protein
MLKHRWTLKKTDAKWNNPDTKGHLLYNSIYMKSLEYTNEHRQKDKWLHRAGRVGGIEGGDS